MNMSPGEFDYFETMAGADDLIDSLRVKIRNLQAECAAYRRLLKGQDQLLTAYRLGRRPPESAFNLIQSSRKALKALGVEE